MKPNIDEVRVITFTRKNSEINNIYEMYDNPVTRTVSTKDLEVFRILICCCTPYQLHILLVARCWVSYVF